jgi:hypothetical protein
VADEVELLEREGTHHRVHRGHAAPKAETGGIARRLAAPRARRVGKDHGTTLPGEEARGVRPVGRVRSEAVQEDDGPLRREWSEDERRERRSVVGRENLPPSARERQMSLLNRAVEGQGIHGDRAEEKEEEESDDSRNHAPEPHRQYARSERSAARMSSLCGRVAFSSCGA